MIVVYFDQGMHVCIFENHKKCLNNTGSLTQEIFSTSSKTNIQNYAEKSTFLIIS